MHTHEDLFYAVRHRMTFELAALANQHDPGGRFDPDAFLSYLDYRTALGKRIEKPKAELAAKLVPFVSDFDCKTDLFSAKLVREADGTMSVVGIRFTPSASASRFEAVKVSAQGVRPIAADDRDLAAA